MMPWVMRGALLVAALYALVGVTAPLVAPAHEDHGQRARSYVAVMLCVYFALAASDVSAEVAALTVVAASVGGVGVVIGDRLRLLGALSAVALLLTLASLF